MAAERATTARVESFRPRNSQILVTPSQTADVRLYTLPGCAACGVARRLLRRRGIEFEEISGERSSEFRRLLLIHTGASTAPQIVIDEQPIGGADRLVALDRVGALLPRVRRESFPVVATRSRLGLLRRRHEVRVVDEDGVVASTTEAGSAEEAESIAERLRNELAASRR